MTSVRAIRGATTLDSDSVEQMTGRVPALVTAVMERNDLTEADIISILFTSTSDLACMHPATAVRLGLELTDVPMTGAVELDVAGSLARCVRLMMHVNTDRSKAEIEHVYLHGAVALRPDLVRGE